MNGTADGGPVNAEVLRAPRPHEGSREGGRPGRVEAAARPRPTSTSRHGPDRGERAWRQEGVAGKRGAMDKCAVCGAQQRAVAAQAERVLRARDHRPSPHPTAPWSPRTTACAPDTTRREAGVVEARARPNGSVTAGNSCPLNDGAAAVVVMSDTKAGKSLLTSSRLRRVVSSGVSSINPEIMGLGPIGASRQALKRAGMTIDQIDRVEINEAFAAQVAKRRAARHRPREAQRERRRDRARPSLRDDGRAHHVDVAQRPRGRRSAVRPRDDVRRRRPGPRHDRRAHLAVAPVAPIALGAFDADNPRSNAPRSGRRAVALTESRTIARSAVVPLDAADVARAALRSGDAALVAGETRADHGVEERARRRRVLRGSVGPAVVRPACAKLRVRRRATRHRCR